MDPLESLNPEQIEAVTATEGPVRVVAGPGTGKTRTLTRRYCHLVKTLGVNPAAVMCATFTNRAANEMKSRIRDMLGDLDLGQISTLHALGLRILRTDVHRLGFPGNFAVIDTEDQRVLLDKIFGDMGLGMGDYTIQMAIDEVLEARKLSADGYVADLVEPGNERLRARFSECRDFRDEIFLRYLYEQKKSFSVDFNDLINLAHYLLESHRDVRERWQARMEYVMVDEFQDVSKRQYRLAAILAGRHHNLFIVGDPDQTIYTWRGAHPALFADFDRRHPGCRTVKLVRNYRSTPQILACASAVIARNAVRLDYRPEAVRPAGPRPVFFRARTFRLEADWVAGRIKEIRDAGTPLSEIAVIYRAHHQSRSLEEALVEGGVPYRLLSGTEFYQRSEIKDGLAWLRMLTSADDAAFLRIVKVPRRKLGRKRLAAISEMAEAAGGLSLYETLKRRSGDEALRGTGAREIVWAVETVRAEAGRLGLGDLVQRLWDLSGFEAWSRRQADQERLDNLGELKRAAAAFGEDPEATVGDFLDRAALFTNLDRDGPRDAVRLMSIHGAKGLEFSAVFLAGLGEGALPSRRAQTPEALEEERRLCYVAMTRAKDLLFLSDASETARPGLARATSRFVFEAGPETVDFLVPPESGGAGPRRSGRDRPPDPGLAPGTRVIHRGFGPGVVVSVNLADSAYLISFERLATPRSISFAGALETIAADPAGPDPGDRGRSGQDQAGDRPADPDPAADKPAGPDQAGFEPDGFDPDD